MWPSGTFSHSGKAAAGRRQQRPDRQAGATSSQRCRKRSPFRTFQASLQFANRDPRRAGQPQSPSQRPADLQPPAQGAMAAETRAPLNVAILGAGSFVRDAYLGPLQVGGAEACECAGGCACCLRFLAWPRLLPGDLPLPTGQLGQAAGDRAVEPLSRVGVGPAARHTTVSSRWERLAQQGTAPATHAHAVPQVLRQLPAVPWRRRAAGAAGVCRLGCCAGGAAAAGAGAGDPGGAEGRWVGGGRPWCGAAMAAQL